MNEKKHIPYFEICCIIAVCAANLTIILYFIGIKNQPTNELNLELRQQLVSVIQTEIVTVFNVAAMILYAKYKVRDGQNDDK